MSTSSDPLAKPTWRRHLHRWRRRGGGSLLVAATVAGAVLLIAIGLALCWLTGERGRLAVRDGDWFTLAGQPAPHPVEAFLTAAPPGPATAIRVVLLMALALVAGVGLVRVLLGLTGPVPVPPGVRSVAWTGGLASAAASAGAVLAGLAARPLGVLMLVVSIAVPLLLASTRLVAPVAAVLAGLLAVVLGTGRTGVPLALDVIYAVAGAVLLGASVFGVALSRRGTGRKRLALIAAVFGALASVAGVGQFLLSGPRSRYDAFSTGYGLAALAQAVLPILVTLALLLAFLWLAPGRPGKRARKDELASSAGQQARSSELSLVVGQPGTGVLGPHAGRLRAAELSRLASVGLVLAFAAAALLATLPRPPAAPVPGQPLLRPVDLPFRRLAVQVMPMRPGPNLVHIGASDPGGQRIRDHHSVAEQSAELPGTLTVSAGGDPVPVTPRPGASGGWAVLDIPAGATELTISGDGASATVPIQVGTVEADPATRSALTGQDGPECASAILGAQLAPATPAVPARADQVVPVVSSTPETGLLECPSQRLTEADAEALRDTVIFLARRGISALHLVADDSPRGVAAADLVRAEAARQGLPLSPVLAAGDTLFVVSGWATAAAAVEETNARAVDQAGGGIVLAPWLLVSNVLAKASSEVLPLRFNPQETDPRQYATTLASVFPGEQPSAAGYLAWARHSGAPLDERVSFYGAAPVDLPMGVPMVHGENPASWYPGGTVVPINPPIGPVGGTP